MQAVCFKKLFLPIDFFLYKNTLSDPDPRGEPAMKAGSARVFSERK